MYVLSDVGHPQFPLKVSLCKQGRGEDIECVVYTLVVRGLDCYQQAEVSSSQLVRLLYKMILTHCASGK